MTDSKRRKGLMAASALLGGVLALTGCSGGSKAKASDKGESSQANERTQAEGAVTEDTAEALAYLVDPFDLVSEVPGVELQQASWSSERIDYDPDSPDWELDEEDVEDDEDEDGIG